MEKILTLAGPKQPPTHPDATIWDELSAPFERESLSSQNVPTGKTKITGIEWAPKGTPGKKCTTADITISKFCVVVTFAGMEKLEREQPVARVRLGTGMLKDETVLMIKPVSDDDSGGYKLTQDSRSRSYRAATKKLMGKFLERGLKVGKYKLYRAPDCFFARLIEEKDKK